MIFIDVFLSINVLTSYDQSYLLEKIKKINKLNKKIYVMSGSAYVVYCIRSICYHTINPFRFLKSNL